MVLRNIIPGRNVSFIHCALLLLLFLFEWATAHECMHHKVQSRNVLSKSTAQSYGPAHVSAQNSRNAEHMGQQQEEGMSDQRPLRITVSTEDLFNENQYCTATGQQRNTFSGETLPCSSADDILTEAKRHILLSRVVPKAVQMIRAVLSVIPVEGDLMIDSTTPCNSALLELNRTGFADTDFLLLVTAGPISSESTLAWAAACDVDQAGRPIVGHMNFKPKAMKWNAASTDGQLNDAVRTVVHELVHALGFSSTFFQRLGAHYVENPVTGVLEVSSPNVVAAAIRDASGAVMLGLVAIRPIGQFDGLRIGRFATEFV